MSSPDMALTLHSEQPCPFSDKETEAWRDSMALSEVTVQEAELGLRPGS